MYEAIKKIRKKNKYEAIRLRDINNLFQYGIIIGEFTTLFCVKNIH